MAFVNELIEEKEIEKYGLMKFYYEYEKQKIREYNTVAKTFYQWVVDKKNEVFLIRFGRFYAEDQPDHGELYTNDSLFIFYYRNNFYKLILTREREKRIFKEGNAPIVLIYEATWALKSIEPDITMDEEFEAVLKKALTVYGRNGVYNKEYTKYIINFDF